jgi:alpha-galactosidase
MADKYARHDPLEFETTALTGRSVEYCSYIMEALTTGKLFRFMGNVRNDGYVSNLPAGCCVEVPTFADDTGLRPTRVGELPVQCAAACMTNVNVQILTAEAALTGDPELLVHALALDPLTGAVCTLKQTRDMAREMFAALLPWMPQFAGKQIKDVPTISIPANMKAVEVPLDPALAIGARFGKLISQKTE